MGAPIHRGDTRPAAGATVTEESASVARFDIRVASTSMSCFGLSPSGERTYPRPYVPNPLAAKLVVAMQPPNHAWIGEVDDFSVSDVQVER